MALLAPWAANAQTLTVHDGSGTNNYVPFYGYYADEDQTNQMIYPATELADMNGKAITQMVFYWQEGGYNYGNYYGVGTWTVSLGETTATTLSGLDNTTTLTPVFTGVLDEAGGLFDNTAYTLTITFDDPYVYGGSNLLVQFDHTGTGEYEYYVFKGETVTGASYSYNSQRNFLPKTTFSYATPSSCAKPTGLTVTYTGGTTASVSWTSDASAWNMKINGTPVDGPITNPYPLNNLELGTTYTIEVQADCGGGTVSEWSNPKSFTTDLCLPEDMCEITYSLTDQYNDSWNGASINVIDVDTGKKLTTITMPSVAGPYEGSFLVCDGRAIRFEWISGSYPAECGFVISDASGADILNVAIGDAPTTSEVLTTYTVDCPSCIKPSNLQTTAITTNSATMSWTGSSDSYILEYRPWYPAGEDTSPTSDVMTPAYYDLSSFTGTGSVVIRHYNCYNQFALIVDDIVVRNSLNEIVFQEDFEGCGGIMPNTFTNMDLDGDRHVWEIAASPDMKVNGNYGLASYSYDNDSGNELYPDNWLIIKGIPMGGSIAFNYCAQDADWTAENFCVYVSTEASIVNVPLNVTTYNAEGLEPNTPYAWQVKGICGGEQTNWASAFFQTLNDVIVFETDGNWNEASNWDVNRVPTVDDKVRIDANALIPEGVIAYAKTTTMGTGSITIKDGGQLKQGTATIDVTVEKEITGYNGGDGKWYLVATPVGTTLFASYSLGWGYAQNLLSGDYDLYAFDPTQNGAEWYNYEAHTGDFTKLYANQGYLYANNADITIEFSGTTPVKSLEKTVTEVYTYDGSSANTFNGFKLVGNPFTCQSYLSFAPTGEDPENVDFYVLNAAGDDFELGQTSIALNVCQGALFYADASGNISFSSEAPAISKRASGVMNINLIQSGNIIDQARIRLGEGMRLAKYQLHENNSAIYIPQDEKDYAVVYTQASGEMPLNFKAETTGKYNISFKLDGANLGYLHLYDKITGEDVNLFTNPEYSFIGSPRDMKDRFIIRFSETSTNDIFAYQNGDELIVNGEGELQVYDVMGRYVASYNVNGNKRISAEQFSNAVYIFRLIGSDVKTQKIVVR